MTPVERFSSFRSGCPWPLEGEMMNRRDILKALAALPIVGRLIPSQPPPDDGRFVEVERSYVVGEGTNDGESYIDPALWEWVPVEKPPLGPVKVLPSLPYLCPLCEHEFSYDGLESFLLWGRGDSQFCAHPGMMLDEKRSTMVYVDQLQRRKTMELVLLGEESEAKIRDIDRVLRYLGETP